MTHLLSFTLLALGVIAYGQHRDNRQFILALAVSGLVVSIILLVLTLELHFPGSILSGSLESAQILAP